jgi:hypothetical protein
MDDLILRNIGTSGVHVLPSAAGINEGGHYFGPSGVHALPIGVAAKQSSHYIFVIIFYFFFLFSVTYFSPRRG